MTGKLIDIHSHYRSSIYSVVFQGTRPLENSSGYLSVGIHPVADGTIAYELLEKLPTELDHSQVIAIGESGFDKDSALSIEQQQELFISQVKLSEKTGLPVIIHCVGRWNELELAFKQKKKDSPAWIIHGFRKMKLADKFLGLGAYLGFGKALLYDETIQENIAKIPLDRIFLETDDAEFDIRLVYEKLAQLKELSLDEVIAAIRTNFETVFDGPLTGRLL